MSLDKEQLWNYDQFMSGKLPPLDNEKIDNADHDGLKIITKDLHKRVREVQGGFYTVDYILRGDGMGRQGLVNEVHALSDKVQGILNCMDEKKEDKKKNWDNAIHYVVLFAVAAFAVLLKAGVL